MFDGLSISISGNGVDAASAVRNVRETLQSTRQAATGMAGGLSVAGESMDETTSDALGLSLALRGLRSQADEAGDEMRETSAEAASTSASFGLLGGSATGASVSVRGLTTSLVVGLVPALALASTALIPVVSALGGLAAIGASIAGVGLVASLGAMATHGEELKASFNALVSTIKTEFAPVFDLAALVLTDLMQTLQGTISELVPAEDTVKAIALNFWDLGEALIAALPAFTELAASLAADFLPAFVSLTESVLPQVPGMVRGMVREFQRLSPMFMSFGRTVGRLLPGLMEFGRTVLSVVAPALGDLAGLVQQGLSAFNSLGGASQQTAVKLGLLAGPLASLVSLLGGPAGVGVLGAVIALKQAWTSNFAQIRGTLTTAFQGIKSVLGNRLPRLITAVRDLFQTWRPVIEPAVNFLVQLLSFGVVNALDLVLSGVTALAQVLSGDFSAAWDTVAGAISRVAGRFLEFLNSLSGGAFQTIVNRIIKGLNKIGVAAEEFLGGLGMGGQFDFQRIEQVELGTAPVTPGRGGRQTPGSPGAARQEIRVTGELKEKDGEITAKIDERVEVNNRRQKREFDARRGGPSPR